MVDFRPDTKKLDEDSLLMHASGRPGKLEIRATKPLTTQRDLSLAYSPGVAAPCLRIAEDATLAYDYTAKGNLVAIISNGTAVLGLGDLGALASKPVMEGKAVLFKRFADIDGIDIEVDTKDVDEFVNCVRYPRADVRRHQPGGHQGARMLHHRAAPARAPGHPGLPRRPARHRHHRARQPDQRPRPDGTQAEGHAHRRERRRRRLDRLHRADQDHGAAHRPRHPLRHPGRHLSGPREGHEPVEVGPCRQHEGAHAGRGGEGRRRVLRPLGQGRHDRRDGEEHGRQAHHLRHGQSRSGDHAGGGAERSQGRHRRHRPLRLSEPGEQRPGLSLYLPRRARRAGLHHQRHR